MTHPDAGRHDVLRHRPFDMDVVSTLIGRAKVTARIGVTEVHAVPAMDGTPHVITS